MYADMILQILMVIFSILSIISCFHIFWLECRKSKLHINIRISWANLGISYFAISTGTLIISANELITKDHIDSKGYFIGYILKTYGSRVNRFAFLAIALERIISTFFFRHYTNDPFKHIGWIFCLLSNILGIGWYLTTEFKIMPTNLKNDLHLIILVPTIFFFVLIFVLNYKFRKQYLEAKLREKYQITQNKEISLKSLPIIAIALCVQLVGNVITRAIISAVFKENYSKFEIETIYYIISNLQLPIISIISLLIFDKYSVKFFPCFNQKNIVNPKNKQKENERDIYFANYKKAWN